MIVLDLEAMTGLAGSVETTIVASASVRVLRRMHAVERDELARAQLTQRELERYGALATYAKRQLEWLAGRLAVKRAIAELTGRPLEIRQDSYASRPYVDHAGVHIGISHSYDVALGAVAPHLLGIDVELVRPLPAELIEYAFAASELAPLGTDDAAVVRLWTLKESFVKMLGLGVPAFDELQLIGSRWQTSGRVAEQLGTREPRCWADIASGYAIALTWSVTQ